jgi:hypothetical protein
MPDGVELAATLYLPPGADSDPVPALLEYLPYRKDDAMAGRDHALYGYLTARRERGSTSGAPVRAAVTCRPASTPSRSRPTRRR